MKIKEITSMSRRDFRADMECEHCGSVEKGVSGYDDTYFHENVIPKMKCKKCNKIGREDSIPMQPKYPEDLQL